MAEVLTVREAVQRAKAEGITVSEYTLRQWVKTGEIPSRKIGRKVLLFYPNIVKYLRCDSTAIQAPATVAAEKLRICGGGGR